MFKFLALFVVVCISMALGAVVNLDSSSFPTVVDGSKNALVEFYAPWCGHCKNLAPEWKIAGETFQPEDDIIIAAVDATESNDLAKKFGIQGYPTIKYFPKGKSVDTPEEYDGGRSADTIVNWVNGKIGTSRRVKVAPSAVAALNEDNFAAEALGAKAALVEFYAPWCGHCKSLAPKYETLANVFAGEKDVLIAKVDATEYGDLATRYGVQGYPTLKFFPAGADEPVDYEGEREVEAMVNFVNEKAGTFRNADGSLAEQAGRVASLDALITAANGAFDGAFVSSLTDAANGLTGKEAAYGKLYVNAAKKISTTGVSYVGTEQKRLASMATSKSVTAEQKTNFQLRQNILKAFA